MFLTPIKKCCQRERIIQPQIASMPNLNSSQVRRDEAANQRSLGWRSTSCNWLLRANINKKLDKGLPVQPPGRILYCPCAQAMGAGSVVALSPIRSIGAASV